MTTATQEITQDMKQERYTEPVLCFVEDNVAWFTTLPLHKMQDFALWDVPYSSGNSSPPYTYGEVLEVESELDIPPEIPTKPFDTVQVFFDQVYWSDYLKQIDLSVEMINHGLVAWLSRNLGGNTSLEEQWKSDNLMFARTPLSTFIHKIEAVGGEVFMTPHDANKYYRGNRYPFDAN